MIIFALVKMNIDYKKTAFDANYRQYVSGEKDAPGRPFLYSTTELFLETFSLNNLNEIPDINEFADAEESLNQEGEI